MTDREQLMYRFARALGHSAQADEEQEAADEGHGTPDAAAKAHWDAAGLLEGVLTRVQSMHDQHVFAAKRMDREAIVERRTGVEYRAGDAA